jgi:uncharacterized protein (DUF697 family)
LIRRTRTLFELLREISLDDIRDAASRHFSLVVTGPSAHTRATVVNTLTGGVSGSDSAVVDYPSTEGWSPLFERASLVVYALDAGRVVTEDVELLRKIGEIGLPVLVTSIGAHALVGDGRSLDEFDRLVGNARYRLRVLRLPATDFADQLLRAVLRELEAFDLALARRLPPFRPYVSQQLISETSRANAEFALMSNLPEIVPVVGNLVTASADLFVLTKNQMLLVFKIAAAYGAEIHSSRKVLTELIPVVGASFFWRSLARELAALVPFGIGAIPKTTIAYTGTYAAGRSAQYYYSTGHRPNREMLGTFYKEALDRVRDFVTRRGNGQQPK